MGGGGIINMWEGENEKMESNIHIFPIFTSPKLGEIKYFAAGEEYILCRIYTPDPSFIS